jgi:hypothetical protein
MLRATKKKRAQQNGSNRKKRKQKRSEVRMEVDMEKEKKKTRIVDRLGQRKQQKERKKEAVIRTRSLNKRKRTGSQGRERQNKGKLILL